MVRELSRKIRKPESVNPYLCLYTRMTNLSGSDCILELCIPLAQVFPGDYFQSAPDSTFIIYLSQGRIPFYLIFSKESSESCKLTVRLSQILPDSYIASSFSSETYENIQALLPNVADSEIFYLIPSSYVSILIRPQTVLFLLSPY